MSRVSLSNIASPSGGAIVLGGDVYSPGMVIQTVAVRSDVLTTYSSAATGDGTTITELNLSITPKFSSSLLVMKWMINCEVQHNDVFLVHKNGSLITTSGYEGYNTEAGNIRWSGLVSAKWDNNDASTIQNYYIQYAIPAGSTASQTFAPAIRASTSTAQILYLNRTVNSTGADENETAVSTGVIMEIAQ